MGKSVDLYVEGDPELKNSVNITENPWARPGNDFARFLGVAGAKWDSTPPQWWKLKHNQMLNDKYGK